MSLDLERRQKLTEDGVGDDYLGCHGIIVRDAGGDGAKEGGDGTHDEEMERMIASMKEELGRRRAEEEDGGGRRCRRGDHRSGYRNGGRRLVGK